MPFMRHAGTDRNEHRKLDAFLQPIGHLVGGHQRSGDLSGSPDLFDRIADLVDHRLRTRLAEGRRWRKAHVLRQVAGADEEQVDAIDGDQFVNIVDRLQRFDHADHKAFFVIRRQGIAHGVDDGASLVSGIDHRHHQPVGACIEIADQQRALMRFRPHDRRTAGLADVTVDEVAVLAKLHVDAFLFKNKAVHGSTDSIFEHPLDAVVWLANQLAGRGHRLEAGDIVTTGSCTTILQVLPGEHMAAAFETLGQVECIFR